MDCSPPGSSVHGVFQARILEWVAISLSRESLQPRDWTQVSRVSCIAGRFFITMAPGKPRRDVNHPPFCSPPTHVTIQSINGKGASWPSQNRASSSNVYRNSVLPVTSRGTQGFTGVMRMDQVGSIARQVLGPHLLVCRLSRPTYSQRTEAGLGCSLASPRRELRTSSLPVPPSWQKHTGLGLGGFSVVCPIFLVLQGPLEVVGESEQPRVAFSLLPLILIDFLHQVSVVTDLKGLLY